MNFRWDKGDIFTYYMLTYDLLSELHVPTYLLPDDVTADWCKADILSCISFMIILLLLLLLYSNHHSLHFAYSKNQT